MSDQRNSYQPSKEHLLTILSEACLQDLDQLYIDAAEKLREYDKLRIEKDQLILELEKLEQSVRNGKEKSCQAKQLQMTYELLNREYQTELQNQQVIKEQVNRVPMLQSELESLQENIKRAVNRTNHADNEDVEPANRVTQAMDLLNDIHDISVDVQALKMKNQDIKMYLEKLDKYIDIRLQDQRPTMQYSSVHQRAMVANTPDPTLVSGGKLDNQDYVFLDSKVLVGHCEGTLKGDDCEQKSLRNYLHNFSNQSGGRPIVNRAKLRQSPSSRGTSPRQAYPSSKVHKISRSQFNPVADVVDFQSFPIGNGQRKASKFENQQNNWTAVKRSQSDGRTQYRKQLHSGSTGNKGGLYNARSKSAAGYMSCSFDGSHKQKKVQMSPTYHCSPFIGAKTLHQKDNQHCRNNHIQDEQQQTNQSCTKTFSETEVPLGFLRMKRRNQRYSNKIDAANQSKNARPNSKKCNKDSGKQFVPEPKGLFMPMPFHKGKQLQGIDTPLKCYESNKFYLQKSSDSHSIDRDFHRSLIKTPFFQQQHTVFDNKRKQQKRRMSPDWVKTNPFESRNNYKQNTCRQKSKKWFNDIDSRSGNSSALHQRRFQ